MAQAPSILLSFSCMLQYLTVLDMVKDMADETQSAVIGGENDTEE